MRALEEMVVRWVVRSDRNPRNMQHPPASSSFVRVRMRERENR